MIALKEIDIKQMLQSEQAKKVGLGIVVGLLVFGAIFFFMTRPAMKAKNEIEKKKTDAQTQLDNDRLLIQAQQKIQDRHCKTACELRELMGKKLAPNRTPVLWAGNLFQKITNEEGLKMSDIKGETIGIRSGKNQTQVPLFEKFKAKTELRSRYHNLGRFIAKLEQQIPMAQLVNLNMAQPAINEGEPPSPLSISFEYAFPRFTQEGFPKDKRPTAEDCKPTTE